MKKVFLEIADSAIESPVNVFPIINFIKFAKRTAIDFDIDLDIAVYSGMYSTISTGRATTNKLDDIKYFVDKYNKEGIPFYLALNGGIIQESIPMEIMKDETEALKHMDRSGKDNGVKNGAVITHNDVLEYILEERLDLTKVSSVIRLANSSPDYETAFRRYDLVVMPPQDATLEKLKTLQRHIDKMVYFLKLDCGNREMDYCHQHYSALDYRILKEINGDDFRMGTEYDSLYNDYTHFCLQKGGTLLNNPLLLSQFYAQGVNKYKVHRGEIFLNESLMVFLRTVHQVSS